MEFKRTLLVLFNLFNLYHTFGLDDLETVFSITETTFSTLAKVPEVADFASDVPGFHGGSNADDVSLPFSKKKRQLLPMFKQFAQVTKLIKGIDEEMKTSHLQTINMLQVTLPVAYRYELRLDSIEDAITMVDLYFQSFQIYSEQEKEHLKEVERDEILNSITPLESTTTPRPRFEQYTLENFAFSLTSHEPTSVRGLLQRLNEMISPSSKDSVRIFMREGIFKTMIRHFEELESTICSAQMSPQQLIYNLYSTLQVTQIKGYAMMQFAWMLLHTYGKGNFTLEMELLQDQFKSRLAQQLVTLKDAMKVADNMVYRCDPKVHIEGQTYTQMTRLLQGYLVNEVDLNYKQSCTDTCASYDYTKQYSCYSGEFCGRQPICEGNIVKCQYYDSDMSVCPSSYENNNSSRRYDWIHYENGQAFGKNGNCKKYVDKVDSWWLWYGFHCSYCMCLCDDHYSLSSHRYWSLRPVESDINNNKIVVGVKFEKHHKVIHFQIKEATLLPKLAVNASTAEWVPVSMFKISDTRHVVEGFDYYKMNYSRRELDLDDLIAPEKHVLTGLRFKTLGSHLNLEIRVTPFDYETGLLNPKKSHWIGNDNTDANPDKPRTLLDLENRDVPTASRSPSVIDSQNDYFIRFTNSDMERDVAQTTIPFIDIQPVSTDPLTPLSGAGLYHKGIPDYGGYVGPKVFTYDPSEFLNSEFLSSSKK